MSWFCPHCGNEHPRQYDEPTLCRACAESRGYEELIGGLREQLDSARELANFWSGRADELRSEIEELRGGEEE